MKRLVLPDLLKGFAVFLIVPVHILELFIDYPGRESLFGKILLFLGGPIAVPVFMMIMGYFAAKSKKSSIKTFLRGIKIFGLGFLLNIGLNFHLLLKIKFEGWQFNPLEYIWGVDIFYLAGLSIIFISFVKLSRQAQPWITIVAAILILALTAWMNKILMVTERNYFLPFIAGTYSWSYFPLFPWLAYPFIGFAFSFWEGKIKTFITKQKLVFSGIILTILIVLAIFAEFGYSITIDLSKYYHHTFKFAVWGLGLAILWALLLRFLITKYPTSLPGNFLQWLGKNITGFYVIQWLIIGNIATAIYQTQSIKKYPLWFLGIFTITVLITWILEKSKIKLAR